MVCGGGAPLRESLCAYGRKFACMPTNASEVALAAEGAWGPGQLGSAPATWRRASWRSGIPPSPLLARCGTIEAVLSSGGSKLRFTQAREVDAGEHGVLAAPATEVDVVHSPKTRDKISTAERTSPIGDEATTQSRDAMGRRTVRCQGTRTGESPRAILAAPLGRRLGAWCTCGRSRTVGKLADEASPRGRVLHDELLPLRPAGAWCAEVIQLWGEHTGHGFQIGENLLPPFETCGALDETPQPIWPMDHDPSQMGKPVPGKCDVQEGHPELLTD